MTSASVLPPYAVRETDGFLSRLGTMFRNTGWWPGRGKSGIVTAIQRDRQATVRHHIFFKFTVVEALKKPPIDFESHCWAITDQSIPIDDVADADQLFDTLLNGLRTVSAPSLTPSDTGRWQGKGGIVAAIQRGRQATVRCHIFFKFTVVEAL